MTLMVMMGDDGGGDGCDDRHGLTGTSAAITPTAFVVGYKHWSPITPFRQSLVA